MVPSVLSPRRLCFVNSLKVRSRCSVLGARCSHGLGALRTSGRVSPGARREPFTDSDHTRARLSVSVSVCHQLRFVGPCPSRDAGVITNPFSICSRNSSVTHFSSSSMTTIKELKIKCLQRNACVLVGVRAADVSWVGRGGRHGTAGRGEASGDLGITGASGDCHEGMSLRLLCLHAPALERQSRNPSSSGDCPNTETMTTGYVNKSNPMWPTAYVRAGARGPQCSHSGTPSFLGSGVTLWWLPPMGLPRSLLSAPPSLLIAAK